MAPKNVFIAVTFAALLISNGALAEDQYRPDEFLGLDLSKAALSPKPLGPPADSHRFLPRPKPNPRARRRRRGWNRRLNPTSAKLNPTFAKLNPTASSARSALRMCG